MAKGITASRAVIRKMRTFLILSALLTGVRPYVYQKCELAELLHKNGLDGYRGYNLANWVCLVQHESNYDTRVIGRNRRGGKNLSSDYGIFQINSIRWCEDGRTQNTRKLKNGCKKSCRGMAGRKDARRETSTTFWMTAKCDAQKSSLCAPNPQPTVHLTVSATLLKVQ
ncbi:lysozyme C-like isoform X2 [Scyliorhinus canicula]|uniref:lysozyme C-like isoform X2 n=1 Tax=Scyliorhinus canicula TaxID=7830 RepID=UPI0018F552A2|nr:lysozyme C-like isoform X2 [Scyliorhinus canicula]